MIMNRTAAKELIAIAKSLISVNDAVEDSALDIANEIRNEMRSKGGGQWDPVKGDKKRAETWGDDWGDWESDAGRENEEDDDYKVLTDRFNGMLSELHKRYSNQYKGFRIQLSVEEKSSIFLQVSKK